MAQTGQNHMDGQLPIMGPVMAQATLNLQELQQRQQLNQRLFDGTATKEEVDAQRLEFARLNRQGEAEAASAAAIAAGTSSFNSSSHSKSHVRKARDDQTDNELMESLGSNKWSRLDDEYDMPASA